MLMPVLPHIGGLFKAGEIAMAVLNKHVHGVPTGAVYIGRGSKWGNPYTSIQGRNTKASEVVGSREEAIEKYRQWLWQQVQTGEIQLQELAALHGKDLVCFCAPKPCHGDVLVRAAKWALAEINNNVN